MLSVVVIVDEAGQIIDVAIGASCSEMPPHTGLQGSVEPFHYHCFQVAFRRNEINFILFTIRLEWSVYEFPSMIRSKFLGESVRFFKDFLKRVNHSRCRLSF